MKLTVVLDLVGTFVFAISGATAGIKHKLDIFGILVLSFAAANAGGITRDLLIGATPPPAITDWRYIVVAFLAGLVTFFCNRKLHRLRLPSPRRSISGLTTISATFPEPSALSAKAGARINLPRALPLESALRGRNASRIPGWRG